MGFSKISAAECIAIATALVISGMPQASKAAEPRYEHAACTALGFEAGELDSGVACGWLSVPESRDRKKTRALRLAVLIGRARAADHVAEPILYLHGGPGIATLDVVPRALKGKSWPLLREKHDVIFFDQRGTGRSTPHLCTNLDTALDALFNEGLASDKTLPRQLEAARACRKTLEADGADIASYNAAEIARDADDLRRALGYERWNVFATSFGTLPAMELLRRDPKSIRTLILDSAFPPNSPNAAEQISITAESYAALQARCDMDAACRKTYPQIRASAASVVSRLNATPIPNDKGLIDGDAFSGAVWTALVEGKTVAFVPEILRRAAAGDDDFIRRFVRNFGDSGHFGGYSYAQGWLVNCHDIFRPPTEPAVAHAIAANPDLAGNTIAGEQDSMCAELQPAHASPKFFEPVTSRVPTLIYFGEFDPATSHNDALTAKASLPHATLVEIAGASHAPFYTDACTKGIALAFLDQPDRAVDASCVAARPAFHFANAAEFDAFAASLSN